jgi:hypothetical protein
MLSLSPAQSLILLYTKGEHMRFLSTLVIAALLSASSSFALANKTFNSTSTPSTESKQLHNNFILLDGTPIKLRLGRNLSSADAKTGESVDFEVLEDIKIGDVIVIARGAIAIATVTHAKPKGRMGKGGKLDLTIDYVRLVSSEKAALRAVKETKGGSKTGTMTGAMVATGILFFPAAPFFLFMKGKEIKIPKGSEVTAYVSGDVVLDRNKFVAENTDSPEIADHSGEKLATSKIHVRSTPEGAEIYVNGKFVGSTPSVLNLQPGEHTIVVKQAGYKDWERTISTSPGGEANIVATLERPENY